MSRPDFVHLHVHTEYSLLDGANRISDLVKACVADGQPALALTDHGNLFGALEHYQECTKAGIKPLLGCEVYVAKRSRRSAHNKSDNGYNHLTLLARNEQGWRNLLRLASIAYTEGYSFRPRIDKEVLSAHADGLVCLSGCLSGEVNQLAARGAEAEAERAAADFRDLFGGEHFYLELQRNGIEAQERSNEALVRLSARTGIPLVGTNDIHYLRHEDCATQDVLLCINTKAKLAQERRFRMDTDTLFFRTREQMAEAFRDLPGALRTTMDVAERIDVRMEFGRYHLPVFVPDDGATPEALFDRLCEEGLARFYAPGDARARERLEHEKRVIREIGFVSYFLIVWDLIRWARENGIPVGPGRGSAAGSLVAYVLGITRIEPLRYDLLFERFLNPARISMPDIDIDFCQEGRGRVLEYTRRRYGADHVSQIVTFATMAGRSVVRDVGRVMDLPLADVDRIAKALPQGPGAPSLEEFLSRGGELATLRAARPEVDQLFRHSVRLEGAPRHISTHAAGVVIADRPICEYVPLATHKDDVVTQWPGPQLEQLGLLKMDYLGLVTLTILERTLAYLRERGAAPPDLDRLPERDAATYRLLAEGDTLGVFQLESDGMRKLLGRLRPDRFEDLIAVLALYRPGPLESGMVEMFLRRKHGQEPIQFPHPSLEPILSDTYGCIVYQEQVMRIASTLSGFAPSDADNLRKAMGKKQPEIMAKFESKFLSGAVANGCGERVARETWENIVKFGGYGFNKSHSTAYAVLSLQTAYLKANHRLEFLAANMSCELHDSDKIKSYVEDARRAGLSILPPDVSRSAWHFVPEGDGIRYGLGAIKGTGEKAVAAIAAARARVRAPYALRALCTEVDSGDVTKLTWEALVKAGAFDAGGQDRGLLLGAVEAAMGEGARRAADRRAGQAFLFGEGDAGAADDAGIAPADGARPFTKAERLAAEREVLGFYLQGHPLEEHESLLALLSTCRAAELAGRSGGSEVTLAGMIDEKREIVTKRGARAGQPMARFRLCDPSAAASVVCFAETYDRCRAAVQDGAVAIVRARVEERDLEAGQAPSVIADDVQSLDQALARFPGSLQIAVEPPDEPLLPALRELLAAQRGRTPVALLATGNDGREQRVRLPWNVALGSALISELERLLGRGRVRLSPR